MTTPTMDTATLQQHLTAGDPPRVLDVRTSGEFETEHIPGAYNVPLDTLREHREELARHLGDDVVLVCRSGARAAQAESALAETGVPNMRVLEGGMLSWTQSGAPTVRGRPRWDLERQVRLVAGSLVLGSTLGSVAVPRFKWVAAFVGGGLTFAALSITCAMAHVLGKLPYNRGPACPIGIVTAQLAAGRPPENE